MRKYEPSQPDKIYYLLGNKLEKEREHHICGVSDHISVLHSKSLPVTVSQLFVKKNSHVKPIAFHCLFYFLSLYLSLTRIQGFRSFSIWWRLAQVLIPLEETLLRRMGGGWWCYHDYHKVPYYCIVWVGSPSLPPSLPPPTIHYQATVSVSPPPWENITTRSQPSCGYNTIQYNVAGW